MALPWPLWYLEACRVLSYPGSHAGNVPGTVPTNNNNNSNNNVGNSSNNIADHQQHFAVLEMMQKMAYHHHQQQQQQLLKQQKFNNNNNNGDESTSIKSGLDDDEEDDDKRDHITTPQPHQPHQPHQPQPHQPHQPQQTNAGINDDDDEDGSPSSGTLNAVNDADKTSDSIDDEEDEEEDEDFVKQNGGRTKTTTTIINGATAEISNNTTTTLNPSFHADLTPPGNDEDEDIDDKKSSIHSGNHNEYNNTESSNHNDYTGGSKRRKQPRKNVTSIHRDVDFFSNTRNEMKDRYHSDTEEQAFHNLSRNLKREPRDEAEGGATTTNDQSEWGDFKNGGQAEVGSPKIQSRRLGLLAHHGLVPNLPKSVGNVRHLESMNMEGQRHAEHNGDGCQASSESTRSDDVDDEAAEEDENKALFGLLRNPAFNPWAYPENLAPPNKEPTHNGLDSGDSPGTSSLSLMDRRFMPSPPLSSSPQHHHHHHHHNNSNNQQQWTYEEQFKQLYELSDDPKRKDFLDDLFSFMQKRGTPVNRIPIMAKQTLDLYELFQLVVSKGGLVEVINKKLWREITKGLNLPSSITSAAFTLRTQYMKYLYPYECERLKLSTLSELQYAVDGNRREGRRPGGFGEDTPRGPSMPSLMSPIQNHPLPGMMPGLPHINPATLVSGYQDSLSGLSRRTPITGQNNGKDKEISPNSSPYHQLRPQGQRPMNIHLQGHPHQLHQSQMFYANNHHPSHPSHPLRPYNDSDTVSMATRAMAEMTKRMEDASRLAAAAANQRFVDHLQATPISPYCLPFKHGKRENSENFSPSPPKQMLLDSNRHQIQTDQSISTFNGINIKLTNSGDGAMAIDDSLVASMEINGVLYKGLLYPQKKQQQQHNGESINNNNNNDNNNNINHNSNNNNNNNNDNKHSRDKRPKSPVIEVNEAE